MRATRSARSRRSAPASLAIAGLALLAGCTAGAPAEETVADQGNDIGRERGQPATRSPSASPAPQPTTAGSAPSTRAPSPRRRSTPTSSCSRRRGHERRQPADQPAVETFINDGVDAIVLLPTDGAALTEVAIKAMEAGIPVINVDREFSSPFAARTTDPR